MISCHDKISQKEANVALQKTAEQDLSSLDWKEVTEDEASQYKGGNDKNDSSYTAIKKEDGIYLVASWHKDIIFGPFHRHLDQDTFIYYPKDRTKEFRHSQQINYHEETSSWYFADGYVQMRPTPVYPGNALTPIRSRGKGPVLNWR